MGWMLPVLVPDWAIRLRLAYTVVSQVLSKMSRNTSEIPLDPKLSKRVEELSQLNNSSSSELIQRILFFCENYRQIVTSICQDKAISESDEQELIQVLSNSSNQEQIMDVLLKVVLSRNYEIASQKIQEQIDPDFLDSLETEDDILAAAVEMTRSR
ncbi:hypothetical protein AY600_06355 [Phormidium willei BDU 130791]|nr:hypothetical protein AY600_06355 [Phormidium willei BDU 130791]